MSEEKVPSPKFEMIVANGIDAASGGYAFPPLTPEDFKKGITGALVEPESKALKSWLKWRKERFYSLKEGLDPRKLAEAGWGIVFPVNTDPAIIEALRPLIEWRRAQVGDLCKVYADTASGAVRPMTVDSKSSWLVRQGAENYGPVDPDKVPYYLLLVGDPNQIDYRFQYLLDVQYGVGRIYFDTPAEYARYAENVVAVEKNSIRRRRQLSFFGAANPGDAATQMSAQYLVGPLVDFTGGLKLDKAAPWEVNPLLSDAATKACLNGLLNGGEMPGLLFTASHGMGFAQDDPRQVRRQGALLCQDWPGPRDWKKPIPEEFYFSADDLESGANLQGLIAFFFACYSAGTPQFDEFYRAAFKQRGQIAAKSFIAPLPQKMLAQGALAVIGHVERAWGYSFAMDNALSLGAFRSALHALMSGAPVGHAFEYFNERYAEFTTDLTEKVQRNEWDPVDALEMVSAWTATSDAKNYVVLGDPAVRALVTDTAAEQPPALKPISLTSKPAKRRSKKSPAAVPGEAGGGLHAMDIISASTGKDAANAAVNDTLSLPAVPPYNGAAPYGLGEDLAQVRANVGASISQFVQKLSAFLSATVDNAVTLEIATYSAPDMAKVRINGSQIEGALLRAVTVMRVDGDIQQVVPLTPSGEPDAALWALHLDMVRQAQTGRAEMLRAAISAVTSLTGLGAPKP